MELYYIIAVTDSDRGEAMNALFRETGLPMILSAPGRGTAKNEHLAVYGLDETPKTVTTSVASAQEAAQLVKAVNEAEAYPGPSLIIAYAPCINHGINMSMAQAEIRKAVEAGYWPLYRFNPELAEQGKNPLTLDSKEPTGDYQAFIRGETRYATLLKQFPETAEKLFAKNEEDAKERLEAYKKMAAE